MSSQPDHILVLEDHPAHQKVLAFNLTSAGFKVTTAADVTKALMLAYHQHFDLIITDYHLPDATGDDFIH
jgi:CheY-like chemotaxis protein